MHRGHEDDESSERLTLEMIKRFGAAAEYIAREMADITKEILEMQYGEAWHDIADAIERYSNDDRHLAKDRHANDNDQPPSDNGTRS